MTLLRTVRIPVKAIKVPTESDQVVGCLSRFEMSIFGWSARSFDSVLHLRVFTELGAFYQPSMTRKSSKSKS